jgi:RNA recognition motif-containing protein
MVRFAVYSTEEEALKAIEQLNGTKLEGREITVKPYFEHGFMSERRRSRDVERKKVGGGGEECRRLYVGNLPFSVDWKKLKDIFNKYSKVERADVVTRRNVRIYKYLFVG